MGAAGYIAPRHIRAISNLGFELVSAFDPVDPTSQVASLFPRAHIFTDFFTFESHFNLTGHLEKVPTLYVKNHWYCIPIN
jgi:UDP-N-acetyl-2-amino-2-deoxyglucuronate dehydrogenase